MAKPKKKKITAAIVLVSEEAMVGTLNSYIELALKLKRKQAKLDERIAALKSEFDEENQSDREQLGVLESSIQLFSINHRGELFPDKKSKEFANATIGFRDTPPAVGKVIDKDTWEAIALRLDSVEWGDAYVNWTAAPEKAALLRDRANLTPEQLSQAGIRFESGEVFYIDPSSSAIERSKIEVSEVKAA